MGHVSNLCDHVIYLQDHMTYLCVIMITQSSKMLSTSPWEHKRVIPAYHNFLYSCQSLWVFGSGSVEEFPRHSIKQTD